MNQADKNGKYKAGQKWSYITRSKEKDSYIKILKVEQGPPVIHISIYGLKIKNSNIKEGVTDQILHLPIAEEALDKSVLDLLEKNSNLPDFQQTYNDWKELLKKGQAGVYSIPVSEAIDLIEQTINKF